jgi:hypothetical protein
MAVAAGGQKVTICGANSVRLIEGVLSSQDQLRVGATFVRATEQKGEGAR